MCARTIYCTNIDKKVFLNLIALLPAINEHSIRIMVMIFPFVNCRLLKRMLSSSLSPFVERFVAAVMVCQALLFLKFMALFLLLFLPQVYRLRLLGDYQHSTRIAFVEFVMVIMIFLLISLAALLLYYLCCCFPVDLVILPV